MTSTVPRVLCGALALATALAGPPARAEGGVLQGRVKATPDRYLHETVVYLKEVKGPSGVPPRRLELDEKGLRFSPHVLRINAGDTVQFLNSDNVEHNVFTPDHEGYNLGLIKPNGSGSYQFDNPGVYTQLCSIHAEMLAYVFVGANPYHALVDATGAWRLDRVPAGTWTVAVWNSHLQAPEVAVTVVEGKATEVAFTLQRAR
jgi:plastocyanin